MPWDPRASGTSMPERGPNAPPMYNLDLYSSYNSRARRDRFENGEGDDDQGDDDDEGEDGTLVIAGPGRSRPVSRARRMANKKEALRKLNSPVAKERPLIISDRRGGRGSGGSAARGGPAGGMSGFGFGISRVSSANDSGNGKNRSLVVERGAAAGVHAAGRGVAAMGHEYFPGSRFRGMGLHGHLRQQRFVPPDDRFMRSIRGLSSSSSASSSAMAGGRGQDRPESR